MIVEELLECFQYRFLGLVTQIVNGNIWSSTATSLALAADNGGEYLNKDMDAFCEEIAVRRSFTIPYKPDQNPYAERAWGIVLRKVRTSMVDSNLPEEFWTYAIKQAALVHNILPDLQGNIPYELVHQQPFDYHRLRPFGCLCYYLLPERDRASKLSPRALPAIHLGEDPLRNGYLVYVPNLRRFTSSYHLVFSEEQSYPLRGGR
mmetsp:Transcript_30269/g.78511  ORF Transcript_30269/g.78511 Transcript_30269/m.78511 type:complete len:205 (-) Transcript_30269:16-630(-)